MSFDAKGFEESVKADLDRFVEENDYNRAPEIEGESEDDYARRSVATQTDSGLLLDLKAINDAIEKKKTATGLDKLMLDLIFTTEYIDRWVPLIDAEISKRGLSL